MREEKSKVKKNVAALLDSSIESDISSYDSSDDALSETSTAVEDEYEEV